MSTDEIRAKTNRLNLRVASDDDALFRQAARLRNESLSDFVLESARERAQRQLAARTRFDLEGPAWEDFVAALDRPAEANPLVIDLLRRSKP